eukprot:TRINITY_DN2202_c0_g3_i1.p1 TRINITY_DN2202_c0_g3~~TRINITY_DN2202_c0_g3_i1.p1  ORF type:complete len:274 (+),score=84.77 TRINITY_DN2202_c0_g3_i1:69-824(+)
MVEAAAGDPVAMRLAACKLMQLGAPDAAVSTFERILELRPEEPQSYRDLAAAMVLRGRPTDATTVLTLLCKVVMGSWDIRFHQVEVVALVELFSARCQTDLAAAQACVAWQLLERSLGAPCRPVATDLRVVATWNLDVVNLELHVIEPNGERCYPFHNHTAMGGLLSKDMARGYGPVEYLIRNASAGTYQIFIKLYASSGKTVVQPVSACVTIHTFYGDHNRGKCTTHVVHLERDGDLLRVADVVFSALSC